MIDSGLFSVLLWSALGGVCLGALYLLVMLVVEWVRGELW